MLPELFTIPGLDIPIFSYGLMMVLGFLGGIQLAKWMAPRKGLDPELFVNAAIIALLAGIFGARLSHVLENWSQYTDDTRGFFGNLGAAINIREGGLTFFGGLLVAFPITAAYAIWKKIPVRAGMDIVAPCIMIGLAFGRVGCFLNGCCYGAECQVPWSVTYPFGSYAYNDHATEGEITPPSALLFTEADREPRLLATHEVALIEQIHTARQTQSAEAVRAQLSQLGGAFERGSYVDAMLEHADRYGGRVAADAATTRSAPVHPSQLYSTANALLIAAVLVAFWTLSPPPGRVFALMFLLLGTGRYVLEMLRVEPAVIGRGTETLSFLPPQSYSMVLALVLVLGGAVMWFLFRKPEQPDPDAPLAPAVT